MKTEAFILPKKFTSISLNIPGVVSFQTIAFEEVVSRLHTYLEQEVAYVSHVTEDGPAWSAVDQVPPALSRLAYDMYVFAVVTCTWLGSGHGVLVTAYYPEEKDRV